MKVSDTIICKNSFKYREFDHTFYFKKGKEYTIFDIYDFIKVGDNSEFVKTFCDGAYCNLRKETYVLYFHTVKELRKLKLDKIEKI